MNVAAGKEVPWKSRDPWLCVLALILCEYVLHQWLGFGVRRSLAFSEWLKTPFGLVFIAVLQGPLWLFLALWFSRASSISGFLKHIGLRQGFTFWGWCAAWLALGIALINSYGASKGWTASSTQPHIGYAALGVGWWVFRLRSILLAPFYEEVVTRGFLYRAFRGSFKVPFAIAVIIFFSAYFHFESVTQSLFTFLCLAFLWGLLCLVREWTGSLWNCLLCHTVYNLVVIHLWRSAAILMLLLLPYFVYISLRRVTVSKTADPGTEPDAAPNSRPLSQRSPSPKVQSSDSQRTPSIGRFSVIDPEQILNPPNFVTNSSVWLSR